MPLSLEEIDGQFSVSSCLFASADTNLHSPRSITFLKVTIGRPPSINWLPPCNLGTGWASQKSSPGSSIHSLGVNWRAGGPSSVWNGSSSVSSLGRERQASGRWQRQVSCDMPHGGEHVAWCAGPRVEAGGWKGNGKQPSVSLNAHSRLWELAAHVVWGGGWGVGSRGGRGGWFLGCAHAYSVPCASICPAPPVPWG